MPFGGLTIGRVRRSPPQGGLRQNHTIQSMNRSAKPFGFDLVERQIEADVTSGIRRSPKLDTRNAV